MKAVFYPDLHKNNARQCALGACRILIENGIETYFDERLKSEFSHVSGLHFGDFDSLLADADVVLAAGGDGTIMRCAKKLAGTDSLMLGINTGRLGFLASLEQNELDLLKRLSEGKFFVNERMVLTASVISQNAESITFCALNEVVVSRADSHMCDYRISVDSCLVSSTRADGVMFATPTGSTAYALSAGGPVIEPHLECIEFISICPHSLFSRPMLLSSDRCIKIVPDYARCKKVELSCDGNASAILLPGDYVTVKKSDKKVRFCEIKSNSFFDSINEKLVKPLKDSET